MYIDIDIDIYSDAMYLHIAVSTLQILKQCKKYAILKYTQKYSKFWL